MNDDNLVDMVQTDQSEFADQASLAEPPPEMVKPAPSAQQIRKLQKRNSRVKWTVVGITGLLLLLIGLMVIASRPTPKTADPTPPTPTITPAPSELEKQLKSLDQILDEANPYKPALDPPPLDMEVSF